MIVGLSDAADDTAARRGGGAGGSRCERRGLLEGRAARSAFRQGKKTVLSPLSALIDQNDHVLPRQARDKHRKC